ncbi:hypothetical protein BKA64DRAFT_100128 [Cadophora sp. MPI-SDFR-AT-0126]|nr:hypothetical protein BKA64DRAFT_100128 [Leotiomycetes sp. MPI-SDFR-AT-0126]
MEMPFDSISAFIGVACPVLNPLATGAQDMPGTWEMISRKFNLTTCARQGRVPCEPILTFLCYDKTYRPKTDCREEALKLSQNPDPPLRSYHGISGLLCCKKRIVVLGSGASRKAVAGSDALHYLAMLAMLAARYSVPAVTPSDKYPTSSRQCRVPYGKGVPGTKVVSFPSGRRRETAAALSSSIGAGGLRGEDAATIVSGDLTITLCWTNELGQRGTRTRHYMNVVHVLFFPASGSSDLMKMFRSLEQ